MTNLASGVRIGSYELLDLIGQTNMSEVWRAQDPKGKMVAVKTISAQAGEDPQLRARFVREGGEHQQLKHPGIVPILDFFEQDGDSYLVMEYLSGGSVEDRLESQNWAPLSIPEALRISSCILPALDYAHQRLVIHRDVKPSNILLQGDRAYLGDFGIALALGRPRLTSVAQIMGTRCYMSPEQIQTPLTVTHLTDVFSFGCVLYEMLTGRQPYDYGDETQQGYYALLAKRVHQLPVPPSQWNPEINARLERIVLTSLAPAPENRFPGCGSFARALEGVRQQSSHKPAVATPLPTLTPLPPPAPPPEQPASHDKVPPKPIQPVPAAKKVSTAGNTWAAIVAGLAWTPFAVPPVNSDQVGVAVLICTVVSNVLFLRMLYKAWETLPGSYARTTPGKAVGYLLIPIFNLYWTWVALAGFPTDYNRYLNGVIDYNRYRAGGNGQWQTNPLDPSLYKFFFILLVFPTIAAFLPVKNLASYAILLNLGVLIPIMIWNLAQAINRLLEQVSQGGR